MKTIHPSERDLGDALALPATSQPGLSRIGAAVRCYCGPGSGGSSKSSQAQTTATDEGAISSGKGSVAARDGSFVVSQASYAEPGSLVVSGKNASANVGNLTAQTGGTITVNEGFDGEDVSSLVNQFTEASAAQVEAVTRLAEQQQEQINTLSENRQTGEDKTKNLTLAALAALAIGGVIWIANK